MRRIRCLSGFVVLLLIHLLDASSENEVLPEFEAVMGSTANLPCQVPSRPPSSGIKCIFWYKDDEVMSVYTVDARDGGTHSLHVPSERLRSRAHFDPSPWPPILRLVAVKESDAGVYYCRVDYRWDRTYMYTVVLKVIVPPQKLAILNDHDEEIIGMAGPFLEGKDVKMTCEAIGGKPTPVLTWWRGQHRLEAGSQAVSHGQVRLEYTFVPTRADLLTVLTCRSVNNNITAPNTVSVQIDMYLEPVDIRLTPHRVSFTAGLKVEMRCYSGGSRPPARMSWFLDNEPLSNHTDLLSMDGNRTTSILAFWPARSDHNKHLRCRGENFLLSNSALEDGWRINITYIPLVTLNIRSSSQQQRTTFLEGDDVRFSCDVRANPLATQVGWRFEGRPLAAKDPDLLISYRSLMVRRVKRKHRGKYQCYAKNSEGIGVSRIINLRAMYAPVCRKGLRKTYSVPAGEIEQIECQVEADPPKVDFSWSFSNAVDRHYNVSHTSAGLRSIASYKPAAARDYGTLYCWGKNSVGEQQMPCIFTIIPVGPPDTLQNCTSTNVSVSSVTIVCATKPSQSENRYNLEMFMYHNHEMVYQSSAANPHFVINNLTASTELLFVVYVVNSNGKSARQMVRVRTKSSPTEEKVFGHPNPEESSPSESWWVPSLIIIAALFCFLLFATWRRFKEGSGCRKCKDIPKKFHLKKGFNDRMKENKNYIDKKLPDSYEKRTPCV